MPVRLVSEKQQNIVIRPFVYVYEKDIKIYCTEHHITPVPHPCPLKNSKRAQIKQWLNELSSNNSTIKGNLLKTILSSQKQAFS